MHKKNFKRLSSMVCAMTLTATVISTEPLFHSNQIMDSCAIGEADGTAGRGGGNVTSRLSAGYGLSGDSVGYRIYLVPNNIWCRDSDTETAEIGINSASVQLLDEYHNMAVYELSCPVESNHECSCSVNDSTALLHEFYVADVVNSEGEVTKKLHNRQVEDTRILSRGMGNNNTPDFSQLFEGITDDILPQSKTLKPWGSSININWDFTSFSQWANERFMNIGEHREAVEIILQNYKRIISDDKKWSSMKELLTNSEKSRLFC